MSKEQRRSSNLLGEALLDAIRQAVRGEIEAFFERSGKPAGEGRNENKEYFTVKEAADFARMAPSTIRLYIRKRQLRAQRVGRRVIIKRMDLETLLESHPIETINL